MHLKQGDLFWGMDNDFVKDVMEKTEKQTCEEGEVLFKEGEPANYFYILIKGRIKLSIGDTGPAVYMAHDPGQVLGWSTLLGRQSYSATAMSVASSKILKLEKADFLEQLSRVPESEAMLFKRVAQMLGDRLVAVYPSIA